MKYYENEYALVNHDPEKSLVEIVWKNEEHVQSYPFVLAKAVAVSKQHKVSKWYADMTALTFVSDQAQTWIKEILFPNICDAEVQRFAIVVSPDLIEKYISEAHELENTAKEYGFQSNYFAQADDAKRWLKI